MRSWIYRDARYILLSGRIFSNEENAAVYPVGDLYVVDDIEWPGVLFKLLYVSGEAHGRCLPVFLRYANAYYG